MTDLSGSEPIDRWARSAHPERQLNKVIQLRVWNLWQVLAEGCQRHLSLNQPSRFPLALNVGTKFLRQGIRYADLSARRRTKPTAGLHVKGDFLVYMETAVAVGVAL